MKYINYIKFLFGFTNDPLRLYFFFFFLFSFLQPYLQYMEVPRLGVKSELLLPAYTTATAMPDLSCVHNLYHSSWYSWIIFGSITTEP